MFETSVVTARAAVRHRYPLLTASITIHTLAIAAILAASIHSVSFPRQAPNEYKAVFLPTAPVIPPPLGSRQAAVKPAAPQHQPAPAFHAAAPVSTPRTIPDGVVPVQSGPSAGPTATTSGGGGDASGAPYGDPNGVPGGVDVGQPPSPAAPPSPEITYRPGGEVRSAAVLQRVDPEYPRLAIAARIRGIVVVQCIIGKRGEVRDAQVVQSTSPLFDKAALDAVQRWKFAPGMLHGQPVDTYFELTINFTVR